MRFVRGFGSLLLLGLLLVGAPWALLSFGAGLGELSVDGVWRLISAPASDRTLIAVITALGWLAWGVFALSVLLEAVAALTQGRVQIKLPGLGWAQRGTAVLVFAVVAMLGASSVAGPAAAAPVREGGGSGSAVSAPAMPAPADGGGVVGSARTVSGSAEAAGVVHTVEYADTLWELSETYLGDGFRWREIAAANKLSGSDIDVGQKLIIPVAAKQTKPATAAGSGPRGAAPATVTVRAGDSLSLIAERLWGDPDQWQKLWQANRDQLSDPDLIDIGQKLIVPGGAAPTKSARPAETKPAPAKPAAKPSTPAVKPATKPAAPAAKPLAPEVSSEQQNRPAPSSEQQIAPSQQVSSSVAAVMSTSVGLLLAAGLISVLAVRRRRQLQARRPGQLVIPPSEEIAQLEGRIHAGHDPLTVAVLDQALRAIGAFCHSEQVVLPQLVAVRIDDNQIHLLLDRPAAAAPPGVQLLSDGSVWVIDSKDVDQLTSIPALGTIAHPWPALVSLGSMGQAQVLLNLEAVGALTITAAQPEQASRAIGTLAAELAVSPWSSDLDVTLVGAGEQFTAALDQANVRHLDDIEQVLEGLEVRAQAQQPHLNNETVGQKRLDEDLADAWSPHLVLLAEPLTDEQAERLRTIVTALPRVAIAAAVTGTEPITGWQYRLSDNPLRGRLTVAMTADLEWDLAPTLLTDEDLVRLAELMEVTADAPDRYVPAPWWDHHLDAPAGVTVPREGAVIPLRRGPINSPPAAPDTDETLTGSVRRSLKFDLTPPATAADLIDLDVAEPEAPMLRVFGEPEIVGAAGEPSKNPGRCMEAMFYLLNHPRRSNNQLATGLTMAPTSTKPIATYLRKWLGADPDGSKYFPEAPPRGTGYELDQRVTSDWHHARELVFATGVNGADTTTLRQIAAMITGPVFGSRYEFWSSVRALKVTIDGFLIDVTHVLTNQLLDAGDIPGAQWAVAQGLIVDPNAEILLTDQAKIAARCGKPSEVKQLIKRIDHNAKTLETDIGDETRAVLNQLAAATR